LPKLSTLHHLNDPLEAAALQSGVSETLTMERKHVRVQVVGRIRTIGGKSGRDKAYVSVENAPALQLGILVQAMMDASI